MGIWFVWILCHINHCRLLNTKSFLYIYIKYIWFGLVGSYGISPLVVNLMPNSLYTFISNIYDLVWLSLINHCWLFNVKFSSYIYIKYIWFGLVGSCSISTIVGNLMQNPLSYIYTPINLFYITQQWSRFKYSYVIPIIQFRITIIDFQVLLIPTDSSLQPYS